MTLPRDTQPHNLEVILNWRHRPFKLTFNISFNGQPVKYLLHLEEEDGDMNASVCPVSKQGAEAPPANVRHFQLGTPVEFELLHT